MNQIYKIMNNYGKQVRTEAIELAKEFEDRPIKETALYHAIDLVKALDKDIDLYGTESAVNYLSISLRSIIKVYGDLQKTTDSKPE